MKEKQMLSRAFLRKPIVPIAIFITIFVSVGIFANAASYYVATNGNDSNTGTEAKPFRTILHGASVLQPGDTLLVKSGTYRETFYNSIPGGTSWSQPVTVAAYPGHTVTIRPDSGAARVFTFANSNSQYIVIEGFILDAVNTSHNVIKITDSSSGTAHHIRIQDCEVMNAPLSGILINNGSEYNVLAGLDIHHNGTTDFDHGVYISSSHNTIEDSDVYQNSGWGIHIYSGNRTSHYNVVRRNRSFDNARVGDRGAGIIIGTGTGNAAYNNIVWGNVTGIQLSNSSASRDNLIVHNTVFGNGSGIVISGGNDAVVKNNIVYQNTQALVDGGTNTILSHNLETDPLFDDPASLDFRLTPSSPAIDAGTTVSLVTDDFLGQVRSGAPDIGAIEYRSRPLPPHNVKIGTIL